MSDNPIFRNDSKPADKVRAVAGAWRRDALEGTGVTQESAKAAGAASQKEWDERGAPYPNKDKLAQRLAETAYLPEDHPARAAAVKAYEDARASAKSDAADPAPGKRDDARRQTRNDQRVKAFVQNHDDGGVPPGYTPESWAEQVAAHARRLARGHK